MIATLLPLLLTPAMLMLGEAWTARLARRRVGRVRQAVPA